MNIKLLVQWVFSWSIACLHKLNYGVLDDSGMLRCSKIQKFKQCVFLPVHEGRAKTIMIGTNKDHIAAAANTAVEYYGHSFGMCVVSKFKPLNSIE